MSIVIEFVEEDVAIRKEFIKFSYGQKNLDKQLLVMLIAKNIITVKTPSIAWNLMYN